MKIRHKINKRPRAPRHGELAFVTDAGLVERSSEEALSLDLITRRRFFGEFYPALQPDYFYQMPHGSGVFVRPLVTTSQIIEGAVNPGDIDLLIIPYEGSELILERTLAIEVKAIRARFDRQSKSPNEYGFSQAASLLKIGFPYVAVAHLIISDRSPIAFWRDVKVTTILDANGRVGPLKSEQFDMLPASLIDRGFGRMLKNCPHEDVGLVSTYIGEYDSLVQAQTNHGYWLPYGRRANFNERTTLETLQKIALYFDKNYSFFLDNPRYDPR